MVSIMEMIVNQNIIQIWTGFPHIFQLVEKMVGNPLLVQADRPHIDPERGGTERLAKHLLVPQARNLAENVPFEFVIDIVVVLISAPAHYNCIYITETKIITKQNIVDSVARLQDSGTI